MKNKEKTFKICEIVLGAIAAALLIAILVLRILDKSIPALTYSIVGVVILFLVCDEVVRSIRRRRDREEAAREREHHPETNEPETVLPKDAFEFSDKPEEKQP